MTRQTRKTEIDAEIDANLKRAFDNLANEPVPDRFTDLLNQLRTGGATDASQKEAQNDD
ncbi:NepR family anti-sigma factor [Tateyamaria sp. ANG-S1]|uniref:NepR family anti-sigma factor n=1 Tax=Tateyamaria sp. ANG-S1 TaxID=1577905 RepID=UPI00187BDA78|nr:NepR family anti-sigma factor [Tateyamaria sp. ANG-S1]